MAVGKSGLVVTRRERVMREKEREREIPNIGKAKRFWPRRRYRKNDGQ